MRIFIILATLLALAGCETTNYYGMDGCDYRDPLCDSHNGYLASGGKHGG